MTHNKSWLTCRSGIIGFHISNFIYLNILIISLAEDANSEGFVIQPVATLPFRIADPEPEPEPYHFATVRTGTKTVILP